MLGIASHKLVSLPLPFVFLLFELLEMFSYVT